MIDPYMPPSAELEEHRAASIDDLPRFSAWWVFFLTVATLGIYSYWWLLDRSRRVNALIEPEEIPDWFMYPLFAISVALSLFDMAALFIDVEMFSAAWLDVLYIVSGIGSIVWVFWLRSKLEQVLAAHLAGEGLSIVLTFFFQNIYLAYKINEALDRRVQSREMELHASAASAE